MVPARRQDIQGQCTKKDRSCQGKEVRDSRYNDMVRSSNVMRCFESSNSNAVRRFEKICDVSVGSS